MAKENEQLDLEKEAIKATQSAKGKKSAKQVSLDVTSAFNLEHAKKEDAKREKAKSKPRGKQLKVQALRHLSGEFHLPYSKGDVFQINEKQAEELIKKEAAKKTK